MQFAAVSPPWVHQNGAVDVLLVEDDPSVAASVMEGLKGAGLAVAHVDNGARAISHAASQQPDIVLLDLGLPDMDGQDVCRKIRATSQVPIIILSARADEIDRVLALEFGADDYMVKPFGMRELVARIKAVARRSSQSPADSAAPVQQIGPLQIDRRQQKVFVGDEEVYLTPKEFDLLAYLANDPGAVFRRKDIMSEVWGTDWYGTTKTVDAHVASLRKKLGKQDWVEAVRGVGFRLDIPES